MTTPATAEPARTPPTPREALTSTPSPTVIAVMRELARLDVDEGCARRAADRIVGLVDRRAAADALAADCYQLALKHLVCAVDGNQALDTALRNARELLDQDPTGQGDRRG